MYHCGGGGRSSPRGIWGAWCDTFVGFIWTRLTFNIHYSIISKYTHLPPPPLSRFRFCDTCLTNSLSIWKYWKRIFTAVFEKMAKKHDTYTKRATQRKHQFNYKTTNERSLHKCIFHLYFIIFLFRKSYCLKIV